MKNVLLILFSCLLATTALSQTEFKGSILYDFLVSEIADGIDEAELKAFVGTSSEFFFQEGNYLQTYNGGPKEFDCLDVKHSRFLFKDVLSDTIFQIDPIKDNRFVIKDWETQETKEVILGVECRMLKLQVFDEGYGMEQILEFYYGKEPEINGEDFNDIKMGFMDFVYGHTNAIPLKMVIRYPQYTLTILATKITHNDKLDLFALLKDFSKGATVVEMR